ncbi:haloacid dehalogenase-like hydrolase [Sphaerisporangium sp. NPDC051011]|uniref:HAD family hydrolase n=1 Tax=Sphaerisporangium sp. NPDC051011 TaxID=3155792 RepID=UPI0033EA2509
MATRRIVLWDIDHTLIDTGGVGRDLSGQAFEQVTGTRMLRQAKIDGITESVIFRETAKLHGLPTSRRDFERFAEALTEAHIARSAELRKRGHVLPGASAALDSLGAMPHIVQTVVTGNVRRVAEIKLRVFGLDRTIIWDIGTFGDDDDVRSKLVRISLGRATSILGETVTPSDAVLIGDTPADVEAALENGVPVIAVASGRSSADELREAGALRVLPDLADTASVVKMVLEEATA